jgi:glyoxylase-like metal-dependent hydrolase (beta-lactamase superfamily II)
MANWTEVVPGIWRFDDSCSVYAVEGSEGFLIVDAGTGQWLNHLDALPARPVALVCTHYFRDHSAGAVEAARRGIPVYVPEGEREIFEEPEEHFRRRETYIIYDNLWNLYAPIEGIKTAGVLQDYGTISLAGLSLEVVPQPGATVTQCGLACTVGGKKIIFCGETIHSAGRVPRVAPLQYNYNDLPGAINVYHSARILRRHEPDALFPSLGKPILERTDEALGLLQESLRALSGARAYDDPSGRLDAIDNPKIIRVTDHVWYSASSTSVNWYLVSESGKVLVIDYGYDMKGAMFPAYSSPSNRRVLLHDLDCLKEQFGVERIDVVLVSHFHDDHVCGIPLLQRLFGTECWAANSFADLIEQPEAHCFPCTWHQPCRVDRRFDLDETVIWEEYTFHFAPMTGHTRFASLIGFEADGKRFAHTGDQYFFADQDCPFAERGRLQNHVYRNGALIDGYDQSGGWLLDWKPEVVIRGHQEPLFTDPEFFDQIEEWIKDYRGLHERIMPLGGEETHFNLDSWGGWIWPYRTHLAVPGPACVSVTVRNPFPREAALTVRLVGPEGWEGSGATLIAPARAEVCCELEIIPDGPCRRRPFAVELSGEGHCFGQVAEALITVGGARF